jgi:hypothetical protein
MRSIDVNVTTKILLLYIDLKKIQTKILKNPV